MFTVRTRFGISAMVTMVVVAWLMEQLAVIDPVARAYRVAGVIDGAAEREPDTAGGERVADRACVGDRACEPVELGNTSVSPSRAAASACSSPGRARLVPVRP